MELHNLKPAVGSIKSTKRVGRGEGSKRGGTSTRGHNGQKSRSGYSKKIGFEGGQQPLQRRVPKFGFTNLNRVEYNGVNLDTIQAFVDAKKLKVIIVKLKRFRHHGGPQIRTTNSNIYYLCNFLSRISFPFS